jgi:hypothetical protein
MEQKKQANPKVVKVLAALLLVAVGALIVRSCFGGTDEPKPLTAEDLMNESLRKEMLPGLDPYAVVSALEEQGMTATKSHMKSGTSYTFKGAIDGVTLDANIVIWRFGKESMASGINGMTVVGLNPDIQAGKPFFGYLASLRYDGAEPTRAKAWAEANYNTDSATTIIGEAHFLIRATSQGARMLFIRHAMPYDLPAEQPQ